VKVTIVRQAQITSTNPANATGKDTIVEYVTEGGRIDTVIVAGADPTPDEMAAAIKSHQAAGMKHTGTTLDV
jgi:diacylglycerol kinase family enzyme